MHSGPFVRKKPRELLKLYNLGTAYGRRPSEIVGIDDEWAAYQFDAACLVVGRKVENALAENSAKIKKDRKPRALIIQQALGEEPTFGKIKGPVKTVKLKPGESIIDAIDRATENR